MADIVRPLADFLIPIGSGLTPRCAERCCGGLTPERQAELRRQLRDLDDALASAAQASRSYFVRAARLAASSASPEGNPNPNA